MLSQEPHGEQRQSRILPTEPVVICIEGEVIEIEEPEPESLGNVGVRADGVVLVGHPHDQDDVEGSRCVFEEFRHDRFHA